MRVGTICCSWRCCQDCSRHSALSISAMVLLALAIPRGPLDLSCRMPSGVIAPGLLRPRTMDCSAVPIAIGRTHEEMKDMHAESGGAPAPRRLDGQVWRDRPGLPCTVIGVRGQVHTGPGGVHLALASTARPAQAGHQEHEIPCLRLSSLLQGPLIHGPGASSRQG